MFHRSLASSSTYITSSCHPTTTTTSIPLLPTVDPSRLAPAPATLLLVDKPLPTHLSYLPSNAESAFKLEVCPPGWMEDDDEMEWAAMDGPLAPGSLPMGASCQPLRPGALDSLMDDSLEKEAHLPTSPHPFSPPYSPSALSCSSFDYSDDSNGSDGSDGSDDDSNLSDDSDNSDHDSADSGYVRPGLVHVPMVNDFPFPTPKQFIYRRRLAPRRVQFESFGCEHCKRCQRPFSSTSNAEAHFRTAAHGNQNPLFVKYEPKTGRWERFYRRRRA